LVNVHLHRDKINEHKKEGGERVREVRVYSLLGNSHSGESLDLAMTVFCDRAFLLSLVSHCKVGKMGGKETQESGRSGTH